MNQRKTASDGKKQEPTCDAMISEPPWYLRRHRCEHPAKFTVGAARVCGTHRRVAERWQREGRLSVMLSNWWGIGDD